MQKKQFSGFYFGYLAAIKTQNGAAMSVGRVSTFIDIYIERDMKKGYPYRERGTGTYRPYDNGGIQNG